MGLTVAQTKQAAIQAANLATVMGTDLSTAARVMGDLFSGNATMINRYIKGLDETILKSGDTSKILNMLNDRIGNQATEAAKTGVGVITLFNNVICEAKENAGMLVTKGLTPFVTGLRDVIGWLNNTHPAISGSIVAIGSLTTVLITLRVTGILGVLQSLMTWTPAMVAAGISTGGFTAMVSAASVAVKTFFASLGPIGWALIAVGTLATAWFTLGSEIKSASKEQKEFNKQLRLQEINQQLLNKNLSSTERFLLKKERENILAGFMESVHGIINSPQKDEDKDRIERQVVSKPLTLTMARLPAAR